jgi:hypothetical protein
VRGAKIRSATLRRFITHTVEIPVPSTILATRPTVRLQVGQAGMSKTASTSSRRKRSASCGA